MLHNGTIDMQGSPKKTLTNETVSKVFGVQAKIVSLPTANNVIITDKPGD